MSRNASKIRNINATRKEVLTIVFLKPSARLNQIMLQVMVTNVSTQHYNNTDIQLGSQTGIIF